MSQILLGILGGGAGAPQGPSGSQNMMSALGGYLTSSGFSDATSNIFGSSGTPAATAAPAPIPGAGGGGGGGYAINTASTGMPRRKGYAQDNYGQGAYA